LLCLGGCREEQQQKAPNITQGTGPEEKGRFLNEPAGTPPDPFVPQWAELHIRTALDAAAVKAQLGAIAGGTRLWAADDAGAKVALPAPVLRLGFGAPRAIQQDQIAALNTGKVRGNLVLWYPLMQVRERLNDGRAGVWRGITRLREELPTKGGRLGGTPVLFLAAISALDVTLLDGEVPKGYERVVTADAWPTPAGKALFTAFDDTPVAYLVPKSRQVIEASFDSAVESLVPLVKQGGQAWILLALPLAEERKPERL